MNNPFENHVIHTHINNEDNKVGYYLVKNPERSSYWFQISYAPGIFILSGDCYEMMIKQSLKWLTKDTINSTGYFLKKVVHREQYMQFSAKKAYNFIEEIKKEIQELNSDVEVFTASRLLKELEEFLVYELDTYMDPLITQYLFLEKAQSLVQDRDYPDLLEPSDQFNLQMKALTKFCDLIEIKE